MDPALHLLLYSMLRRSSFAQPQNPLDLSELSRRFPQLSSLSPSSDDEELAIPESPISALPYEILSEIFVWAVPSDDFPTPCSTQSPLLVSQISSHWRRVALSTPHIWHRLHIDYRDQVEDVGVARLWLQKSGNLPLDISLSVDFNDMPQQGILNLLCEFAPRWRHVRFHFQHLLCPPMYQLDMAVANTPMLQSFEFHGRDLSSENLAPVTELLSYTPGLRQLTWVDDMADIDTLMTLPLSQLTNLSLSMENGTLNYLTVLSQCAQIEHLRLTRPSASIEFPPSPILLEKLSALEISADLTPILHHLILPSLTHVSVLSPNAKGPAGSAVSASVHHPHLLDFLSTPTVTGGSTSTAGCLGPAPWDPSHLVRLVSRSGCQLTELYIYVPILEAGLVECLHAASSSLRKLRVYSPVGPSLGEDVLSLLVIPPKSVVEDEEDEENGLCPYLEDVVLDVPLLESTRGLLADALESRLGLLKTVTLQAGHPDLDMVRDMAYPAPDGFILDVVQRKVVSTRAKVRYGMKKGNNVNK